MITNFEKKIYNNHLVASRKAKGEPFRLRENFDKLEEEKLETLKKLSRFFNSYNHINQEEFFIAPYKVYDDDTYYPLEYFTKPKAISSYSKYHKKMELEDPDSDQSMERLKESFKFVYTFCKEKSFTIDDYMLNRDEPLPYYVDHLKKHKINFYTLHALTFSKPDIESELLEFVIPNFFLVFQKTRVKFYSSSKMKEFSKAAKVAINNKLKNNNKTDKTENE